MITSDADISGIQGLTYKMLKKYLFFQGLKTISKFKQ